MIKFFEWETNTRMVELYDSYPSIRGRKRYTPNDSFFVQFVIKMRSLRIWSWKRFTMNRVKSFKWMTNAQMVELYDLYPNNRGKSVIHQTIPSSSYLLWKIFNRLIKFWTNDRYSNGRAIQLVSKYSGEKFVYTKLFLFHQTYYEKYLIEFIIIWVCDVKRSRFNCETVNDARA